MVIINYVSYFMIAYNVSPFLYLKYVVINCPIRNYWFSDITYHGVS